MEALTTLLLFIGLLIMWVAQGWSKKNSKTPTKPKTSIKRVRKEEQVMNYTPDEIELRTLTGVLDESLEENEKVTHPLNKINSLTIIKKAIIWSEILDKPVSER